MLSYAVFSPFMFISYDCKLIQKHKFQNILNVKWNIFAFSLTHYCKSIIMLHKIHTNYALTIEQ